MAGGSRPEKASAVKGASPMGGAAGCISHLGGEDCELRGRKAHTLNTPHDLWDCGSFHQFGGAAIRLSESRYFGEGLPGLCKAASKHT